MKPILADAQRRVLETFATDRTLVALDFDGTLAPITDHPAKAGMRPSTARLLAEVARRYPCVIVSGRARDDVARLVRPVPVDVVGNHGAEPVRAHADPRSPVARARRALAPIAALWEGVWIEDKAYSLSLHYRNARHPRGARAALAAAARDLPGVRVFHGKRVLNVVDRTAPDKGDAVEAARRARGCSAVIFVGDDETDEHVFRGGRRAPLLGIRVGRSTRSGAHFYLRDQGAIDALLAALVRLRPAAAELGRTMTHDHDVSGLGSTLEFMRLLWGLDHALQKRSKGMAARHGVTGPQRLALRIVSRAPDVSAGDLAATLKIHPSTLTGVLQRLERRRLVTRRLDRGDRRRQRIALSPRGRAVMKASAGSIEQAVARVLRALIAALESGVR